MKNFCKLKAREVEVSSIPVEKRLPSTGEVVVTGHQLYCHEKACCKENCALINKETGIKPFDQ